jgi:hypothetical protein
VIDSVNSGAVLGVVEQRATSSQGGYSPIRGSVKIKHSDEADALNQKCVEAF